jgi:hypothetical protein
VANFLGRAEPPGKAFPKMTINAIVFIIASPLGGRAVSHGLARQLPRWKRGRAV